MNPDKIYFQHIFDAIQKIETYISVGEEVFFRTDHWQDAVIRELEIIGEATKKISRKLRSKYSNIPWKKIAGLRDVLIHDYMGVDISTVWEITQQDLPELKKQIQSILESQFK